jgi:uncharacterized iron-regulated membrane protein
MLPAEKIRLWYGIHKWTSLVCTVFLLLLCVTGLPLVFDDEIDRLLGQEVEPPPMPADTPKAGLDRVIAAGLQRRPGEVIQFVSWDEDEPDVVSLALAVAPDAPPVNNRTVIVDARTAKVLDEPPTQEGLMFVLFKLHTDMFAGLPGELFLGVMGLLFSAAVVSGVVVYGPFMRKLDFRVVRRHRSPRIKWLDYHNLLGIVTLLWALVVGLTGMINTWATPIIQLWRADQLAAMTAPYRDKAVPARLTSLERAVATAQAAVPDMRPGFVAFPGSLFSSKNHYAVFMRGKTPLTARLLKPVLIDAEDGTLTDTRDLPWYVAALLLSQPLHFGDYGGMPLKILWAALDIITIVVLGSGLYLWFVRRRLPLEKRLALIEDGGIGSSTFLEHRAAGE